MRLEGARERQYGIVLDYRASWVDSGSCNARGAGVWLAGACSRWLRCLPFPLGKSQSEATRDSEFIRCGNLAGSRCRSIFRRSGNEPFPDFLLVSPARQDLRGHSAIFAASLALAIIRVSLPSISIKSSLVPNLPHKVAAPAKPISGDSIRVRHQQSQTACCLAATAPYDSFSQDRQDEPNTLPTSRRQ